jgi:hypothetical protein
MKTFNTYSDAEGELIVDGDKVHHSITYYIQRTLTLDEWIALDNAMDEAFAKVFGDKFDDYFGLAGPIPFDE